MYSIFFKKIIRKITGVVSLKQKGILKGCVLLSYDTSPFLRPKGVFPNKHSNQWECFEIARLFLDRGYRVDAINWDNSTFIPKRNYSFVIDIHQNIERLAKILGPKCIKIMHITNAHWQFQNQAENARIQNIKVRKGVELLPRRTIPPSSNIEYSDYATVLGSGTAKKTYEYAGKPIFVVPLSTTVLFESPVKKDFSSCRKNFMWLGGGGLALKGLDTVLEYFSIHPEYNLTVCGNIKTEPDFEKLYYHELYETQNIKSVGKVDIGSKEFLDIVNKSLAIVYPSASEGQAGSVITSMHAGIIPLISKESGVDVTNFGLIFKDNSIESISSSIEQLEKESSEQLLERAKKTWEYARSHHTREEFTKAYSNFIDKILEKK